jgi:hypothetical protein
MVFYCIRSFSKYLDKVDILYVLLQMYENNAYGNEETANDMILINIAIADCYFAQCSPRSRLRQPGGIVLILFSFSIYTSWHRALFFYMATRRR